MIQKASPPLDNNTPRQADEPPRQLGSWKEASSLSVDGHMEAAERRHLREYENEGQYLGCASGVRPGLITSFIRNHGAVLTALLFSVKRLPD